MEGKIIEISYISAKGLDCVGFQRVFAKVFISNDPSNTQHTPVNGIDETNPSWNHVMQFGVNDAELYQGHLNMVIVFFTKAGSEIGDLEVGSLKIPLIHFVVPGFVKFVTAPIQTPSGNDVAFLNIAVKTHQTRAYPTSLSPYYNQYIPRPPPSPPHFPPYQGQYASPYESVGHHQYQPSIAGNILLQTSIQVISKVVIQEIFGNLPYPGDWVQFFGDSTQTFGNVLDFGN